MKTTSLDILEKAQLPASQAKAILRVMEMEFDHRQSRLATKQELREGFHRLELGLEGLRGDMAKEFVAVRGEFGAELAKMRGELGAKMAEVRGELGKEIEKVGSHLSRWVVTCILAQTAVLAGAFYFAVAHWRP